MRSVPIFIGACLLLLGTLGAIEGYSLKRRGVALEGRVLALREDKEYRTTNYRRHETFFWVRLALEEPAGARREVELKASPDEAEAMLLGSAQKVVCVPGGGCVWDDGHAWVWGAGAAVVGLPLGLLLVGWGLWGKVPAYPQRKPGEPFEGLY